ncbi:type II toxin-antitoxin system PemK/MazF family toxin [Thioalkalivibrio sp. ALM2T]|uniref:type II toxin-antitoxin system PemK/MazF family toxin n=1 Tax=Thioalkalivibrio sp. ALM2T TaxID=1158184 RepID=UPI0021017C47|nr:type II toxin-antitoxin system PemK/MazF family toxin [Thioalkalivibrio sp. ALM2T]
MVKRAAPKDWVPRRRDVIWIDCNPQAGREMRDIHPFLVLSPTQFNTRTSLVLGLPMTTADYDATNPFAVVAGTTPDAKTSYILCHQVKSFDWRQRNATPHPAGQVPQGTYREACAVLNQILELCPDPA